MSVTTKKPTMWELLRALDQPRFNFSNHIYNFQGILLAANRWAREQHDENNNKFVAGYWTGYIDPAPDFNMEIVCLSENMATILHHSGPSPEPANAIVWLDSDKIAREQGYMAGFWDGERTDDGIKYAYNIVAIKDTEDVAFKNFISDDKEFRQLPGNRPEEDLYPYKFFKKVKDWVKLPDSQGNPSQYTECLPLMIGFDSSEGYTNERLAFK
ncbi:hypothetical protein MHB59_28650 [Bacillus sp. FSL L8-0642]|uniref:hypothetical protein n=1 Tax=Bacillus sp. FSL L8-0642 TaxID=2921525 RepID=UPI0030F5805B